MPTTLILIRHGHTAANGDEPRMSGWTDFPVSPLGREQIEALARRMAHEPPSSAVYTSPLQRTLDTARKIAGPRHGPLRVVQDLREIGCGEVDGWPVSRVRERYPDLWAENFRQRDPNFRWPGGESYCELRERCVAALRRIAAAHPGERVVVVTHAGPISSVIGALRGESPAAWESCRPGNCSLTLVEWEGDLGVLTRFDDRNHLEANRRPPGG